jgi:hypothetical protein
MQAIDHAYHLRSEAQQHDTSLFVALGLSSSIWQIAISEPGSGKVSRYRVAAGDVSALLKLLEAAA